MPDARPRYRNAIETWPLRFLLYLISSRCRSRQLRSQARQPPAVDINQDAGIAKMTARRALQVLVQEGYAYVRAGMGTYVTPRDEWPED